MGNRARDHTSDGGETICDLPFSESDEQRDESLLRLKERTRRTLPADLPPPFALSMADIVAVLLLEIDVMNVIKMYFPKEKREVRRVSY